MIYFDAAAHTSMNASSHYETSLSASHKIRKRSTVTQRNPCAGSLQQVIIYEAEDMQDGTAYELVHDPGKKYFLRLITFRILRRFFVLLLSWLTCLVILER